jgi:hypothetical protein
MGVWEALDRVLTKDLKGQWLVPFHGSSACPPYTLLQASWLG